VIIVNQPIMEKENGMKKELFGFIVLTVFLLRLGGSALAADIYIPDDHPTVQEGIDAAAAGDKVIVRDGIYPLDAPLDYKGKAITVKSENGPENCILDGQQKTRVVYFHSGETSDSVLSGFVIRNGLANNPADKGGGILCDSSSPTISNCKIVANKVYQSYWGGAASYGGGIYSSASSAIIVNCMIAGNSAEAYADSGHHSYSYGGGIYCYGGSPQIENCEVSGNKTISGGGGTHSYGGGIYFQASSPYILNPKISNNTISASSHSLGGGIYSTSSFPSIVNGIINTNSSQSGAAIYFESSSGSLTNCTVLRNTATAAGGAGTGLYCANSSPKIINSILWENNASEIAKDDTSDPAVTYSDVYGGYDGTGNIDANPFFKNIGTGDFHPNATSPCIDTGDNDAPEIPGKDKDGKPRLVNKIVDMGVYEFQKPPVISSFTADVTSGPPPLAVAFTCKATVPEAKIVKYQWDFGDGSSIETKTGTAKHTYSTSPPDDDGTFVATVKIVDSNNLSTTSREIEIRPFNGADLVGKAEKYTYTNTTRNINVRFGVTNSGNVDAGPFKVTFHLSNDGSTPLAAFKEVPVEGLAAGHNILLSVSKTFTKSIYGQYILITIDPNKQVKEIDDTNNGTRIVIQPVATK
jgi:hypothetical protein